MANSSRVKVKLQSTAEGSSHSYYTMKNTRNTTDKLVRRKYDPTIRKHVDYKETSKVSK